MKFVKYIIVAIIGMGVGTPWGTAQDIHFSQFYSSPLTLNPALTGSMAGQYRVTANFRDQWGALASFRTYGLAYDMTILNKTVGTDIFGIGIQALNDRVQGGGIEDMRAMGSVAYHTGLGENNNHYLAAGFQGGLIQRRVNWNEITFGDQWSPTGIADRSIDHVAKNPSFIVPDLNAGLLWYSFVSKNTNLFGGISMFHINEPNVSPIQGETKLPRRYVAHGGADIGVSKKINIVPNTLFMYQSGVTQLNVGSSVEFSFPKANSVFSLGGWYRLQDAAIVATSFKYRTYRIGFSYDFTTSVASQMLNTHLGTYELSLILTFKSGQEVDVETHPGPKI